jgi:hypothetical protein
MFMELKDEKDEKAKEQHDPHFDAPPSRAPEEPKKAVAGGPTQPSRDEDLLDSLGNSKTKEVEVEVKDDQGNVIGSKVEHQPIKEAQLVGPRGANASLEHLSEEERELIKKHREQKERAGMSSTDFVDSIGNSQNVHEHIAQGHDRNGARLPDLKTDNVVEEAPKHIGPRGVGVPLDTFHGERKK